MIHFPSDDDEQGMRTCSTELSRLFTSLPPSLSLPIAMACPVHVGARMLSMSVGGCKWWTDIQLEEEWEWASYAATHSEVTSHPPLFPRSSTTPPPFPPPALPPNQTLGS